MHPSALNNGKLFFDTYTPHFLGGDESVRVVEIGSQDVNGSIRQFCPQEFEYIGVDFVDGKGVDLVITSPYELPFEDNSVDIVVSSSCFEHSEMFWIVYLEIMRILKPHGLFYLNVPSNGMFHRYPVDCWRFYPDSGQALVTWARHNNFNSGLLESYVSNQIGGEIENWWNDFVAVCIKNEHYITKYPKRMLYTDIKYTNGFLNGLPLGEILNLEEHSEDQRVRMENLKWLDADTEALLVFKNEIAILKHKISEAERKMTESELKVSEQNNQLIIKEKQLHEQSQQINIQSQQINAQSQQLHEQSNQIGAQTHQHRKYKKLWAIRLVKPLIKTEQAISSANKLRRGFRHLVIEKGSIGKAYQSLRRINKESGLKMVKATLKDLSSIKKTHHQSNIRFGSPECVEESISTLSASQVKGAVFLKQKIDMSQMAHNLAIHFHVFYKEVFFDDFQIIKPVCMSGVFLCITVCDSDDKREILEYLSANNISNFDIRLVENKGRDIAPLFVACADLFTRYKYLCHVHTKRSLHIDFGDAWRRYLLEATLGSVDLVEKVVGEFEANNYGLLYPVNFSRIRHLVSNDHNKNQIDAFLKKINSDWQYINIDYPAGSMCWIKTEVIEKLLPFLPSLTDYDDEHGQIDGTVAHVMERCLSLFPKLSGYEVSSYWGKDYWGWMELSALFSMDSKRWQRNINISKNPIMPLQNFYGSFNRSSMNIHWVIPDFVRGAGGHQTIFRIIKFLEQFGHRQTVWLQNADATISVAKRKAEIQEWYADIRNTYIEHLPVDVSYISGDVVIATDSFTAYPVAAMSRFKERFYFIQDNEAQFYPMGTNYLLADNTYEFGFSALCAGNWLRQMAENKGMWARSWNLCADQTVYQPQVNIKQKHDVVKIAFYSRMHTERRVVDLGLAALQELHERGVGFEAFLFGQEKDVANNFNFRYKHLGVLSPKELADLYNRVDIGLVFSATNYSLIPLEMMACGLPVVELDVESTRAVFPETALCFAKPDVMSVADAIEKLVRDQNYRNDLAQEAKKLALSTNWEDSARQIESALIERLSEKGFESYQFESLNSRDTQVNYKASVVIPTYNPGENSLRRLIESVLEQDTPWPFEIVVIDSESSDGSVDFLKKSSIENVRLIEIRKTEFQHGRTRKYVAEQCECEYVVYTTQDALPENRYWLRNLIAPFDFDEKVAGVFGRHVARSEHDEFIQRDISNHFNHMSKQLKLRRWDMGENTPSPSTIEGKLLRCFFSDNNSAVRKKVLKYIPYPEVEWGEDQLWASEVISSGLTVAYAEDAVVIHSHEYDATKTLDTSVQEEKMFYEYFGYRFANSLIEAETELINQIKSDENWGKFKKMDTTVIEKRKALLTDQMHGRCGRFFLR
ncbi:MAG: glycosyltransferase [Burkholderiales bacterium]|nr:glycosyltransferase [Burkholderiales bacterium]